MLILASNGYDKFIHVWRTYMKSHPLIDCYFYRGDPDMEEDAKLVDDTIYVKVNDTLESVYEKLMLTLKFLEPRFHRYDFLYRTNLSSCIDFNTFVHFCMLLPTTNVCAAVIGEREGIAFPSGAGFTLSMDLVKRLVKENPPPFYLDDVTIGKAISSWNVLWIQVNRIDYVGNGVWRYEHQPNPNELIFHYRVKTEDRDEDCVVLENKLHQILSYRVYHGDAVESLHRDAAKFLQPRGNDR